MKRLCSIALLFLLLAFPSPAKADVAPPMYPPGSNPQPGAEMTQVRMVAETVVIDVQRDITPESLGSAHVTADFTMHNLGPAEENMAVRFPISGDNGRGEYPEIGNLQITVNNKQVPYRRVDYPQFKARNQELVPWGEFDVTFPAGQDVAVRVAYDLEGSGYYPYTAFYYVLETGAGWKDTIGSADVILRLPYEASPQNVVLEIGLGWGTTTPGGVFQGNEVRWHFEDFEPGSDQPVQNMEFALVAPSTWQNVLNARENLTKHPNDGEAWGMLAKAYKQVFLMRKGYREDSAGMELYKLSLEAYEKCLSLKPDDAQWHAGFADLLSNRAFWDSVYNENRPTAESFRALDEIHTALELAPKDPVVRDIADSMTFSIQGGIIQKGEDFDFPWLTQTPTVLPSTPTLVPIDEATATPPALVTDTPQATLTQASPTQANFAQTSPTATPEKSTPLCGSAMLLPLMTLFWFAWKRR